MQATRVHCYDMLSHFSRIKISTIQEIYMKQCLLIIMCLFEKNRLAARICSNTGCLLDGAYYFMCALKAVYCLVGTYSLQSTAQICLTNEHTML